MVLFGCFAKLFQKGVSHYTQKNIAFWGDFPKKLPKFLSLPLYGDFKGVLGPLFAKK